MLAILALLASSHGAPWSRTFFGCNADPDDKAFHLEHVRVGGSDDGSASADAPTNNSSYTLLRPFDMFGVFNYAADAASLTIAVVTSDGRVPNQTTAAVAPRGPGLQQYVRRFSTATGRETGGPPLRLPLKDDGADAVDGLALHQGELYGTRFCGPYGWYSGVYHISARTGAFTKMAALDPFQVLLVDSFALDYATGSYYFLMAKVPGGAAGGGDGRVRVRQDGGLPASTPLPAAGSAPTPVPLVLFRAALCPPPGCVNGTATQVVTQLDSVVDGGLYQPQFHAGRLWGFVSTRGGNRLAALDVATGAVTRFPGGWAAPGYHSSDSSRLDASLGVLWATGSVDGRSENSYLAAVSLADGTLAHHFNLTEPLHYVAIIDSGLD